MRTLSAFIAGAIAALWVAAAWAGPPPPASYSTKITGVIGTDVFAGGAGVASASASGSGYSFTASIGLTPAPSVAIGGTTPVDSGIEVQALVDWYVTVSGATPGNVPLVITYSDAVSTPSPEPCGYFCTYPAYDWTGGVTLGWGPEGGYSTEVAYCEWGYGFACTSGSNEKVTIQVQDNTTDFIQIVAGADAGGTTFGATFSASLDPTVQIDPAFLRNNPGVTLQFSPNVGNGALPEPGVWALMLVGVGLACGELRRRRRTARA